MGSTLRLLGVILRDLTPRACVLLLLASMLVPALSAQALSFDCTKAQSRTEKRLCRAASAPPQIPDDSYLSTLDDELNEAYQWAQMRTDNSQELIKAQRHWLKTVRDACQDDTCLARALNARIEKLQAEASGSGCYVLAPLKDEKGKVRPIEPICRIMEKNLNKFCDQPPMVCGLKIAPEFHDRLTLPEWTPLDPEMNRALIEKFIRAHWMDSPNITKKIIDKLWEEDRPKIEEAFAEKRITFSQARLDLYNLGQAQLAYRLDYGNCQELNPSLKNWENWGRQITVPAPVKIHHAPEVVRKLFRRYFPLQSGHLNEVFLSNGKIYDYVMGGTGEMSKSPPEFVGVFVNRRERWSNPGAEKIRLHMENICRFNYRPDSNYQSEQGESK